MSVPTTETSAKTRLSLLQIAAYSMAQFGGAIFFQVAALLLMPFMTNTLAVPAALAGLAVFIPKFWVMICDPLMGTWSDRVNSLARGRRPFVLWGGLGTAAGIVAVFVVPGIASPALLAIYVMLAYTLASTAYSAFSVPYLTMGSEITATPRERTTVMAWRQAFNYGAILLAFSAPWLVQRLGGGRPAYSGMALILGSICALAIVVSWLGLRGVRSRGGAGASTVSLFSRIGSAFENHEFRRLFRAYCVQYVAVGVAGAGFAYYVIYQGGGDFAALTQLAMVMVVGGILGQFFWVRIAGRFGKLPTYRVCIVGMSATQIAYFVVPPGSLLPVFVINFFVGVFTGSMLVMAWSMLMDIIVRDEEDEGVQRGGILAGIWSAGEKAAAAVGALATGLILQAFDFQVSTEGFIPQSPLAHLGIRVVAGIVTPALLLTSLVSLRHYPAGRPLGVPRAAE
jgi:GPH family glycoside/pentoside/hexuronide:cation symporter